MKRVNRARLRGHRQLCYPVGLLATDRLAWQTECAWILDNEMAALSELHSGYTDTYGVTGALSQRNRQAVARLENDVVLKCGLKPSWLQWGKPAQLVCPWLKIQGSNELELVCNLSWFGERGQSN